MNLHDEEESLEAYLYNRYDRPLAEAPARRRREEAGRELSIRTDDGVALAASVFEPRSASRSASHPATRRVVVIASATGVLRRYYAPFAAWLAAEGFTVVTFDYRGIGGSRSGQTDATMHDWGERDLAAVIAWAADVLGDGRVSVVGHSVGGQLVGFLPEAATSRIEALVTVASQFGDYRLWPMPLRFAMAALWYGIVPTVTRAVGYLPGALGVGEDLPSGVALEWARWCRTPGYVTSDETDEGALRRDAYASVRAPMLAFGFHDDTYAPPAAVDALLACYRNAAITRRHVDRSEGRFGHFGFFRSRSRALWREVSRFLGEPAQGPG